jgi:hypothetical protein
MKIYLFNESEYQYSEDDDDSNYLLNPLEGALEIMLSLEDKRGNVYTYKQASKIVSDNGFAGATFYVSRGLWERKLEKGIVILIVNDSSELSYSKFKARGIKLIKSLKRKFNQDAVMYRFVSPRLAKYKIL